MSDVDVNDAVEVKLVDERVELDVADIVEESVVDVSDLVSESVVEVCEVDEDSLVELCDVVVLIVKVEKLIDDTHVVVDVSVVDVLDGVDVSVVGVRVVIEDSVNDMFDVVEDIECVVDDEFVRLVVTVYDMLEDPVIEKESTVEVSVVNVGGVAGVDDDMNVKDERSIEVRTTKEVSDPGIGLLEKLVVVSGAADEVVANVSEGQSLQPAHPIHAHFATQCWPFAEQNPVHNELAMG